MNRTLAIFARPIPYHKELRKLAGSATSAILLTQLDYWFSKKPEGFHKFLEPCHRPGYKAGDSWSEELGFSAKEFRTAFKAIGMAYKSKGEYDRATDKFGGLFYCSYHNRVTGQTWYYRNHTLLDEAIATLANQGAVMVSDQREFPGNSVTAQRAFTGKSDRDFTRGVVTNQGAFTDHSVTDPGAFTGTSEPDFTRGVVTAQQAFTQLTNGPLDHAETTPETTSSESTDREKIFFLQPDFANAQTEPVATAPDAEPSIEILATPISNQNTFIAQRIESARESVPGGGEPDFHWEMPPVGTGELELSAWRYPWGIGFSAPDLGFLEFLARGHLTRTAKKGDPPATVHTAKRWLRKARKDWVRLEDAFDHWEEYQDWRQGLTPQNEGEQAFQDIMAATFGDVAMSEFERQQQAIMEAIA